MVVDTIDVSLWGLAPVILMMAVVIRNYWMNRVAPEAATIQPLP
jgi:hypothetical protein